MQAASWAARGSSGSPARSRSTSGLSIPTTPTIHGPRGTGILARAEVGYDVDQQIKLEFGRLPFHHSPTDSDDRKRLEAAVWNRLAETSSRRRAGRLVRPPHQTKELPTDIGAIASNAVELWFWSNAWVTVT